MLAPWMKMGHGVSEMIACLEPELRDLGIQTSVGCLGKDKHFRGLDVTQTTSALTAVQALIEQKGATVVVALGSPFFEVLPHLPPGIRTIAYEAGDPTPELFVADAAERRRIVENKIHNVYPHVDAVAAISSFIRHDIGWPQAVVIPLGIDNIPDPGPKPLAPPRRLGPLRLGALTRLGVGEAQYKGSVQILELRDALERLSVPVTFELMGRGTPKDAEAYEAKGFTVHLNASEEERNAYLRDIDVFVSTSLWEGTNLPLVEAQAVGTPGLAFDTGAHPEFTPLIFKNVEEMALQVQAYSTDPEGLLAMHGRMCHQFVRTRMKWGNSARSLTGLLAVEQAADPRISVNPTPPRRRGKRSVLRSLKHEGLQATLRKAHISFRR